MARAHWWAAVLIVVGWVYDAKAASTLENVLETISNSSAINVGSVSANIAESYNAGMIGTRQQLEPNQRVAICAAPSGSLIYATSSSFGLSISEVEASGCEQVPSSSFVPIGSDLYITDTGVPTLIAPGTSPIKTAPFIVNGYSSIDASIRNILVHTVNPSYASATAARTDIPTSFEIENVGSTALGSVSTGEIITNIQVDYDPNLDRPELQFLKSLIQNGQNFEIHEAYAQSTIASQLRGQQLGGGVDTAYLATNIASNRMLIEADVQNLVAGLSGRISDIKTTALGAVNGGAIRD